MNANDKNEFEQIPLLAHKFLKGVPLHSLDRLDLPGGRPLNLPNLFRSFLY